MATSVAPHAALVAPTSAWQGTPRATRELNSLLWPSWACQSYMSWPTVGNQFNARLRLSLALRFFVSVSLRAFLQASAADRDVMSCVTLYLSLLLQFLHSVVSTPSVYFAAAPSSACPVSCTDTFNLPGLWLVVILTSQSRLWAKQCSLILPGDTRKSLVMRRVVW